MGLDNSLCHEEVGGFVSLSTVVLVTSSRSCGTRLPWPLEGTGSHPLPSQPAPPTADNPQACSAKGNVPLDLCGLAVHSFIIFCAKFESKTEKVQSVTQSL